jgi:hypothetical protein
MRCVGCGATVDLAERTGHFAGQAKGVGRRDPSCLVCWGKDRDGFRKDERPGDLDQGGSLESRSFIPPEQVDPLGGTTVRQAQQEIRELESRYSSGGQKINRVFVGEGVISRPNLRPSVDYRR